MGGTQEGRMVHGRAAGPRRGDRRAARGLAVVGALIAAASTSMVTALAHTGSVTASENCDTWQAAVYLANNVTSDRIVDVVTTIPGTTGLSNGHYTTTSAPGDTKIWQATGQAPASGTVTLQIHFSQGGLEFTSSKSITPASGCMATPGINTTPSQGGPVGTEISDTALVTGGNQPTGNVKFELFPPSDPNCTSEQPIDGGTHALVDGSAKSDSIATGAVGTYRWVAIYMGDAHNNRVVSGCGDEPVTTSKATPAIVTEPSAGGLVGTVVSDHATVSGGHNPTGDVEFKLFAPGDSNCSGEPLAVSSGTLADGGASSSGFKTTEAGTYRWTATYAGDDNNQGVASACGEETVVITAPTTSTPPPPPPPASHPSSGVQAISTPETGAGEGAWLGMGALLLLAGMGTIVMSLRARKPRRGMAS